jgi:NADH-quinone oxidoreductase subunit G
MYRTDALVRRAHALQQMPQAGDETVRLNPVTLAMLGLTDGCRVRVQAGGVEASAEVLADPAVPEGCALLDQATRLAAGLPAVARVTLRAEGGLA